MQIKIVSVEVEHIKKGKGYSVATVIYQYNGQARTQKVMSFTNPQVFATVKDLSPGEIVEVEITKNDQGYNQFASVNRSGDAPAASASSGVAVPAAQSKGASNAAYEEKEAARQLMIVRQSSLERAIQYHELNKQSAAVEDITFTAQLFVDFVYGNGTAAQASELDE